MRDARDGRGNEKKEEENGQKKMKEKVRKLTEKHMNSRL
jgi:hypothetical protein